MNRYDRLLKREDLHMAQYYFTNACWFSRAHSRAAERALARYGDHGSSISGCVREHFPERVKNRLRKLAAKVTEQSGYAHAARPRGVRRSTMAALGKAVACRDGSGFYGPQPVRPAIFYGSAS